MIDQKLVLTAQVEQTIQIDDLALYCSKWQLKGSSEDGSPIQYEGTSTDVLRRQADGSWLIAIDNPWGAAILG
jgi:ketosteroid isomerase-like protein